MNPLKGLRKLYDWTLHWARSPRAPLALFAIAFIESSFFPIPPDVLLITMTLAAPKRWAWYGLICTAGSVCGAFLGYFIGWGLYETVGKWVVSTYHLQDMMALVEQKYQENAFLTIFTAAFTPIPYKVITIAAGLFKIPLVVLFAASLIGRSSRFFLVAGTLRLFGAKVARVIERYFDILSLVFAALLIGGFIALKHFAH